MAKEFAHVLALGRLVIRGKICDPYGPIFASSYLIYFSWASNLFLMGVKINFDGSIQAKKVFDSVGFVSKGFHRNFTAVKRN